MAVEAYTIYTGDPGLTITIKGVLNSYIRNSGIDAVVKGNIKEKKLFVEGIPLAELHKKLSRHLSFIDVETVQDFKDAEYTADDLELTSALVQEFDLLKAEQRDLSSRLDYVSKELEKTNDVHRQDLETAKSKEKNYQAFIESLKARLKSEQDNSEALDSRLTELLESSPKTLQEFIKAARNYEGRSIQNYVNTVGNAVPSMDALDGILLAKHKGIWLYLSEKIGAPVTCRADLECLAMNPALPFDRADYEGAMSIVSYAKRIFEDPAAPSEIKESVRGLDIDGKMRFIESARSQIEDYDVRAAFVDKAKAAIMELINYSRFEEATSSGHQLTVFVERAGEVVTVEFPIVALESPVSVKLIQQIEASLGPVEREESVAHYAFKLPATEVHEKLKALGSELAKFNIQKRILSLDAD